MFIVERGDFALYLLRAFLYGAAVSLIYLFCGVFRVIISKTGRVFRTVLMFLFDLSFCLVSAFFAMLLVYSANRGQMRIIAILFFAAGFWLIYIPLCQKSERLIENLLSVLSRRLVKPLFRFFKSKTHEVKKRILYRVNLKKAIKYDKDFPKILFERIENRLRQETESVFEKIL